MQDVSTASGLQAELDRLGSWAAVGRAHGIPPTTLQQRGKRWGCKTPHVRSVGIGDGTATSAGESPTGPAAVTIDVDPTMVRWTDSDLIAFHNLDPELNIVTGRQAKRWNQAIGDGNVAEMNGLTLTIETRYPANAILPARTEGWTPPRRKPPRPGKAHRVITVSTDWHAPYQDRGLEDCYLQVLADLQPDEDWDLGDLCDFPTPSRHRTTRGHEATPQEGIDERHKHDAKRVAAAPNAIHKRMLGNHDERIDHAIRDKIGAHVARLARAGDTLPVIDLANLLRYDELGIELLRPDGDYHSVVAKICDGLNARHGTKSGPHGGAIKTMQRRSSSQLSGHDHKQLSTIHVSYDDDDRVELRLSASIGCGCSRALARTYAEDADIHLGFAVVTDHGGGIFNVENVRYDDARRVLYFRDKVYRPSVEALAA
jgi:hypothetical protein